MKTFVVLLRGINVGGHNKMKMAEFKQLLEESGFADVLTYIQSGNILLKSDLKSTSLIDKKIHEVIFNHYGYKVSVLSLTEKEFKTAFEELPWPEKAIDELKFLNITICRGEFDTANMNKLQERVSPTENLIAKNHCLYLHCPIGYSKTKITNGHIEKHLKVRATTRNWNTMTKMMGLLEDY